MRLNSNQIFNLNKLLFLAFICELRICDAEIYLKPTNINGFDATSEEYRTSNLMSMVVPQDMLRSELFSDTDLEPYKTLPKHIHRSNNTDSEVEEGLTLTKQQAEMLRKSWRASCDKKAAKVCKKACVSAYTIVCSAYLCKKGMKRSFKRECKRNCKDRFATGSRSDSE